MLLLPKLLHQCLLYTPIKPSFKQMSIQDSQTYNNERECINVKKGIRIINIYHFCIKCIFGLTEYITHNNSFLNAMTSLLEGTFIIHGFGIFKLQLLADKLSTLDEDKKVEKTLENNSFHISNTIYVKLLLVYLNL
jgi:hypothetical protein